MISIKLYLDTRHLNAKKQGTIKLSVTKKGDTAYINLRIYLLPSQWDKTNERVKEHPNKTYLTNFLKNCRLKAENFVIRSFETGELNFLSASAARDVILEKVFGTNNDENQKLFAFWFRSFIEKKSGRTRELYQQTLDRISDYVGSKLESLRFEDIGKSWLEGFDSHLKKTSKSQNGRNIHLRNVRAVFNDAIDNEITQAYPFRKFKIKAVATPKRSLTPEQLRQIFNAKVDPAYVKYRDYFKLIFLLIGINIVDLCHLKGIEDGRVVFSRAKTHRLYSIKVEPEAMEIINKYRGKNWLLQILDTNKDYRSFYKHFNEGLKRLGESTRSGLGGRKSFDTNFDFLTTYWARHSWATIASSLDIPKETIAAALGHGGNTVTDVYIDFDMKKVDEANRKVIDWVLYGK